MLRASRLTGRCASNRGSRLASDMVFLGANPLGALTCMRIVVVVAERPEEHEPGASSCAGTMRNGTSEPP